MTCGNFSESSPDAHDADAAKQLGERQGWQSRVGAPVFGALTCDVYPQLVSGVTDVQIATVLLTPGALQFELLECDESRRASLMFLQQASWVLGLPISLDLTPVDRNDFNEINQRRLEHEAASISAIEIALGRESLERLTSTAPDGASFQAACQLYTNFRDHLKAFKEGLVAETVVPINLLVAAILTMPPGFEPIVQSLEDVARIYSEPWFQNLMVQASSTAGGYWRRVSTHIVFNDYQAEVLTQLALRNGNLGFSFDRAPDCKTRFRFTKEVQSRLMQHWRQHNENAARTYASGDTTNEHFVEGSSDACPARKVSFSVPDAGAAHYVASLLGVDEARLFAGHPKSPIAIGMDCLAGLLYRAAQVVTSPDASFPAV